jgi:hypothetical protein
VKKTTAIGAGIVRIIIHGTLLTVLYLVAIMISAVALRTWPGLNIAGMPLAMTVLITVTLYLMVAMASVKAGLNMLLLEPFITVLPVAICALIVEPFLTMPVRTSALYEVAHVVQVWPVLGVAVCACLLVNFLFFRYPS